MNHLIIGNIVCFIGSIVMVGVGFIKGKKKILLAQNVQFAIMGSGNLILGGISGAIADYISIIRNFISLKIEFKWYFKIIFISIQVILTVIFNHAGIFGWLPVVAACIFTWCLDTKNEILLKCLIIFAQAMWAIYDVSIKNYSTFAFDIATAISNIIGIFLVHKRNLAKAKENLENKENSVNQ